MCVFTYVLFRSEDNFQSLFSPSTVWALGIKDRSSDLKASAFTLPNLAHKNVIFESRIQKQPLDGAGSSYELSLQLGLTNQIWMKKCFGNT